MLLATYNPDETFFRKQIISLNKQDYSNLIISIKDDCSDYRCFQNMKKILKEELTNFNYTLSRNDSNLGSNSTFESLVYDSSSKYLAFCDQDDIWVKDKISSLVKKIERSKASLVYSDLYVIDEKDNIINKSLHKSSKRIKPVQGTSLTDFFVFRNCVTGCAMVIKSSIAKKALPFPDKNLYVHDHWLALIAAINGEIYYESNPKTYYRIHANNQVGDQLLANVGSKDEYINKKLIINLERIKFLNNGIKDQLNINSKKEQIISRINYQDKPSFKKFLNMLLILPTDVKVIGFEIVLPFISYEKSGALIRKVKKIGR